MKPVLQSLLVCGALGTAGPAVASAFRSYATVLHVEPIVETVHEPVTRRVCSDPDRSAREFTPLSATIGEDIRGQQHLWLAQRSCRTVTERQAREQVAAYRVTYRYRGHTSTTRLSYRPGERIPVNVNLSPLP